MKKQLSNIILFLMFITGLGILLYPMFANFWNTRGQAEVIAHYEAVLANSKDRDYTSMFAPAEEFNKELIDNTQRLMPDTEFPGYEEILDIDGNGVIGYINIERISQQIPIYHGTDDSVLAHGAGHLLGTSFPIGGLGTHCVISAHRGLPSAKLFTDLDKIEIGDTFVITVLDRTITYQVNQILIVLPHEVDSLEIEPDKDYCTLVTCTPYGINTHRLLVRGTRIDNAVEKPKIEVKNEANRVNPLWVAPFVSIPLLIIGVELMLLSGRYKKHHSVSGGKKHEKKH